MSEPTSTTSDQAPDEVLEQTYERALAEAVRVLTAAARLERSTQRLETDALARPERIDWAEFVTLALAGAAANLGGVEAILAGRPGSWEAEGVRRLLESTVGSDESQLWEHRSEPVAITLYVEELLSERTEAASQYIDAQDELNRRADEAATAQQATLDAAYSRHAWEYRRNDAGMMVAVDPAAPAWSWESWRAGLVDQGQPEDFIAALEHSMRTGEGLVTGVAGDAGTAFVARSEQDAAELRRIEAEQEAQAQVFEDLDERLEAQRQREWAEYGTALAARVEGAARALPGRSVPVEVVVDVETYRRENLRGPVEDWTSLESRLVETAVMDTPTPADYAGTPLERLQDQDHTGQPPHQDPGQDSGWG